MEQITNTQIETKKHIQITVIILNDTVIHSTYVLYASYMRS